jgi:histone H3/H4
MAKRENIIPYETVGKLMEKHSSFRISQDAKIAMAELLEEHSQKIGELAVKYCMHAGRTTVTDKDILLAIKSLEG